MLIDVALLPGQRHDPSRSVCVVVDVLRASSSIVTLLDRGAFPLLPPRPPPALPAPPARRRARRPPAARLRLRQLARRVLPPRSQGPPGYPRHLERHATARRPRRRAGGARRLPAEPPRGWPRG